MENKHSPFGPELFFLAGAQFTKYKTLPQSVFVPGKQLSYKFEPNNPYDNKAIAIFLDGVQIGYVRKGSIQDKIFDLRELMDIEMYLKEFNPNAKIPERFLIEVKFIAR
jgi:hypothetical protein